MTEPNTFAHGLRAIDGMINPRWRGHLAPQKLPYRDDASKQFFHPAGYMFKQTADVVGEGHTPEEVVAVMDQFGIERGALSIAVKEGAEDSPVTQGLLACLEQFPDRFFGKLVVDPLEGMVALRKIDKYCDRYPGIKGLSMAAFEVQKPYNDKVYYPVYVKAIERDLPITLTVGIPGPRVPGEVQNPIYLDEVMYFFPDLKIVMAHGGEPWETTCTKLMLKWPNLYYQTSAFLPKYYPEAVIKFANTRGADKVMYAGYWPAVPFERLQGEMADVPFKPEVWPKFLRENALKVYKLGD